MNEQHLPIDVELNSQLSRRAAGQTPENLLSNVLGAIEAEPHRTGTWRLPRFEWRTPRFALSAVGGAFGSVLIAALVIAPFVAPHPDGPTGYPVGRALTTSELAKLMSGPALATNTAIVADAVIDADSQVCPMNRYRTLGVVESMGSQVCVMDPGTSPALTGDKWTGTWAFRYLGPGLLGLIGQVNAASSVRLAYAATDAWPIAGKVFLVDGWLGSSGLCEVSKWVDPEPGDVLSPTGPEPCSESWLSDKAAPIAFRNYRNVPPTAQAATDGQTSLPVSTADYRLGQVEDLHWVGAGGMRFYDSVPAGYTEPVHGTWAVKSAVGPCPNDPPTSSRGCGFWLVLARIPDSGVETLPTPEIATPSPTVAISRTVDSASTPLTTEGLVTIATSNTN